MNCRIMKKIAINFNKSELKLILNCISKERPAPVRIDRGLFGYDIVCSHCSSMLKKLPIYDEKEFLDVLKDPFILVTANISITLFLCLLNYL